MVELTVQFYLKKPNVLFASTIHQHCTPGGTTSLPDDDDDDGNSEILPKADAPEGEAETNVKY